MIKIFLLNSVNYFLVSGLPTVPLDGMLWQFHHFLFYLFWVQSMLGFHINWVDFTGIREGGWLVVIFSSLHLLLESCLIQQRKTGCVKVLISSRKSCHLNWYSSTHCSVSLDIKANLFSEILLVNIDLGKVNFLPNIGHHFSVDFQFICKTVSLVLRSLYHMIHLTSYDL